MNQEKILIGTVFKDIEDFKIDFKNNRAVVYVIDRQGHRQSYWLPLFHFEAINDINEVIRAVVKSGIKNHKEYINKGK